MSLGRYYDNKKDYMNALKWYKKAAEEGNADAQYEIGRCYEANASGPLFINRYGYKFSEENAIKWYILAAKQGHKLAQDRIQQFNQYFGYHIEY